ncbi:MAG: hypothetical protein IPM42_17470 [Saprospiraceae bacterium]|nr:hypothetical protein [Saprospiraceae bacterium]
MVQKIILGFIVFTIISIQISGQIRVANPSFEDKPSDATTPKGWMPCNEDTTPDILPGFWGVWNAPAEGNTFMGLITREDGTFESIGQRLNKAVEKDVCYQFSIELSFSEIYAGYNNPIKLRIWLGESKCAMEQLVFESPFIKHTDWQKYNIKFTPKSAYQYLYLEAYYKDGSVAHKGNILVDNISLIRFCNRA